MRRLHPLEIEHIWEDGLGAVKSLKHEGFFIHHREMKIDQPIEAPALSYKKFSFGEEWLQWQVEDSKLTQTAYFAPRGFGGFLYWYLLYPFHVYRFRKSLKNIGGTIN